MDFTREPIVETIITPKEGCKLVVRASKGNGQEEFFVDSLEVVSFGSALFFRSQDKPKSFLLPVSDYEVLEVREARLVLKNVGVDRNIKIGGGREGTFKQPKEPAQQTHKIQQEPAAKPAPEIQAEQETAPEGAEPRQEPRVEKKRERRRGYRRRRGRDEQGKELPEGAIDGEPLLAESLVGEASSELNLATRITEVSGDAAIPLFNLLAPPPTLISETLSKYRENALFKNAFYSREEVSDDDNGNDSGIEPFPELSEQLLHEEILHVEEAFASEPPIDEPVIETEEQIAPQKSEESDPEEEHTGELWNFSEELSDKKLDQ